MRRSNPAPAPSRLAIRPVAPHLPVAFVIEGWWLLP